LHWGKGLMVQEEEEDKDDEEDQKRDTHILTPPMLKLRALVTFQGTGTP
jgi:hypothetical protein